MNWTQITLQISLDDTPFDSSYNIPKPNSKHNFPDVSFVSMLFSLQRLSKLRIDVSLSTYNSSKAIVNCFATSLKALHSTEPPPSIFSGYFVASFELSDDGCDELNWNVFVREWESFCENCPTVLHLICHYENVLRDDRRKLNDVRINWSDRTGCLRCLCCLQPSKVIPL